MSSVIIPGRLAVDDYSVLWHYFNSIELRMMRMPPAEMASLLSGMISILGTGPRSIFWLRHLQRGVLRDVIVMVTNDSSGTADFRTVLFFFIHLPLQDGERYMESHS